MMVLLLLYWNTNPGVQFNFNYIHTISKKKKIFFCDISHDVIIFNDGMLKFNIGIVKKS